jgi:cobaltochelatase CobN
LEVLIGALVKEGFNVLPVYGWPSEEAIERFFFNENGSGRVSLIVGMSLKIGLNPCIAIPVLSKLGVPVIDAITLYIPERRGVEKISRLVLIFLRELGKLGCLN